MTTNAIPAYYAPPRAMPAYGPATAVMPAQPTYYPAPAQRDVYSGFSPVLANPALAIQQMAQNSMHTALVAFIRGAIVAFIPALVVGFLSLNTRPTGVGRLASGFQALLLSTGFMGLFGLGSVAWTFRHKVKRAVGIN